MLLINCPYCRQARPEIEFDYAGEADIVRPLEPASTSDEEWMTFLYIRSNTRGIHFERWRHTHGCARFFDAARDTYHDRFVTTYPSDAPRPRLDDAGDET